MDAALPAVEDICLDINAFVNTTEGGARIHAAINFSLGAGALTALTYHPGIITRDAGHADRVAAPAVLEIRLRVHALAVAVCQTVTAWLYCRCALAIDAVLSRQAGVAAGTAVGGIREEVGTLPITERLTGVAGGSSGRYALTVVTVLSCSTLDAA
jgi:hypothetical protein